MIVTIHYYKLRMIEFIQFLTNVTAICRHDDHAALNIDTHLAPLEESIDMLNTLYREARGSRVTKELAALDERREKAIILLTIIAKGYSRYCAEEAKRQAAKKIHKLIARHGNSIHRFNYQAETATLSSLVNKLLSEPGMAGAVATLGVQSEVDELKTSNELFNDKFLERTGERADLPAESPTELRKTALNQYRRLIKLIEAQAVVSGAEKYQSLIKELNTLIGKYNEEADSRTNNKDREAEGEEEIT